MKWIEIREEYPPVYMFVLVYEPFTDAVSIARIVSDDGQWEVLGNSRWAALQDVEVVFDVNSVTHWMPIKIPDGSF